MKHLPTTCSIIIALGLLTQTSTAAEPEWTNPIKKITYTGSPLVEVTPFVVPGPALSPGETIKPSGTCGPARSRASGFHEDQVRIRDLSTGRIVGVPLTNHGFGTALVHDGRVYVFAGDFGRGKPWRRITEINMTSSADLKEWTEPVTVIRAEERRVDLQHGRLL